MSNDHDSCDEYVDELQDEIESLRAQVAELKDQVEHDDDRHNVHCQRIAELEAQVAGLRADQELLLAAIDALQKALEFSLGGAK